MARPSPVTLRLLASLERLSREDTGPMALQDWDGINALLDRELTVMARLVESAVADGVTDNQEILRRIQQLDTRYAARMRSVAATKADWLEERDVIGQNRTRNRAIGRAYAPRLPHPERLGLHLHQDS